MLATIWNTAFFQPIMNGLLIFYAFLGNSLGWAILAFTLVLRIVLFPLHKSQLESTKKIRLIQPKLEKLRTKYKRSPQKMQEEQLKLYRQIGYNPLGCLFSTVVPIPIMIAIFQSIRAFSGDDVTGIYSWVEGLLHINGALVINTDFLVWDLSESYLPLAKSHGYLALWTFPYLALAVLTGLSQYFSVKLNQGLRGEEKKDKKKKKADKPEMPGMMGEMSKSMAVTFPLMTGFIALSLPAAVSLYWTVQSFAMIGIQFGYFKFFQKDKK